jgi:hypothetical protein
MSRKIDELSFSGSTSTNLNLPNDNNPNIIFIETKNIASVSLFVFAQNNTDVVLNWSSDNINTDLQSQTYTVLAGTTSTITSRVLSSYLLITYTLSASPTIIRAETIFFFEGGVMAEEADMITLTSGGGTSLVNDGVGPDLVNKGLVAGTGMSFLDNGTTITLNAATTASSVWSQAASVISPITVSTSGYLLGDTATNSITGLGTNTVLVGGSSNLIDDTTASAIVGGKSHSLIGFSGAFPTDDCVIAGGNNHTLSTIERIFVGGGSSNQALGGGGGGSHEDGYLLGGSTNTLGGTKRSGIIGGLNNICNSASPNATYLVDSVIIGGQENQIFSGGGGQGSTRDTCIICSLRCTSREQQQSAIIGGCDNVMENLGTGSPCGNVMIGGANNTISATGNDVVYSVIVGGHDNTINDTAANSFTGGGHNNTISDPNCSCIGSNLGTLDAGCVLMGDSGATVMTSSTPLEMSCRFAGGYRMFSNDGQTTGVVMAANASSWSAVSDRNKKENIFEVDYEDILDRVKSLPVYSYNYKLCPEEEKCVGIMAQDWHSLFPLKQVTYEEETGEEDEEGRNITVTKIRDAKNKLVVEQQDLICTLYACVKDLIRRIEILEG